MPRYSYAALEAAIDALCDETKAADWKAVSERLARYGKWEFEDYAGAT